MGGVHHLKGQTYPERTQQNTYKSKKFDAQLENAQLYAGQKIDRRIDQNLAGLDAKV